MNLYDKETAMRTNIIALEDILYKAYKGIIKAKEHVSVENLTLGNIDEALGEILNLGDLLENALTLNKAAFLLRRR